MTTAFDIARIHVSLDDTQPPIWRRFATPVTTSLKGLHDLVQAAMGWQDYHLWQFDTAQRRYGVPDPDYVTAPPTIRASGVKIATLIARGELALTYTYDFGDNWRHTIRIEGIETAQPQLTYPAFIDGEGRCPPEDVGGTSGFEDFLDAAAKPRHPEHHTVLDWYGDPFDPQDINRQMIDLRFGQIARRRRNRTIGVSR